MSGTRVYVPASWTTLTAIVAADGIGPAPFMAHAVTDALRAAYPDGGDEEWEYAAMTAAAHSSLALLGEDDPPRRAVVAVDADTVRPLRDEDPTLVEVLDVVPFRRIAAVLVDEPAAGDTVAAAVAAFARAEDGDADAEAAVERCLDRGLAWYAAQEIGDLLES